MIEDLSRHLVGHFKRHFLRFLNIYPPFLGAGVRVVSLSADFREIEVAMDLHWYNRNYVGTHFGGSLYSMCDPFFMLILIENLGPDFVVWDKQATIRFKKPGRGRVRALFSVPAERIEAIRDEAESKGKIEPWFTVEVIDASGEVVAQVEKCIYIRHQPKGG